MRTLKVVGIYTTTEISARKLANNSRSFKLHIPRGELAWPQ